MKNNADLFKKFLGDEFTGNYLKNVNRQINEKLTIISSFCKILAEADKSKCDHDFIIDIVNNIMKCCCQIQRNPDTCIKIFDAGQSDNLKLITIELKEFLTAFCNKCNEHIQNKCEIKLEKCDNIYINANESFLNFILLMCIRMALFRKSEKVEISFSSEWDYVTICLKINAEISDENRFCEVVTDTCNDYFSDIVSLLAEKMQGEVYTSDDCIFIKLKKSKGGSFHSNDNHTVDKRIFGIFNTMLADFDDYKYYK